MKLENSNIFENFKFYLSFIGKYRSRLKWVIFFFILKRLPMMTISIGVMVIVDYYIPAKDIRKIVVLILVLIFILIFNFIYDQSYILVAHADIIKNISRDLRNFIVHKLQLLSIGFHNRNHSGRLYSKIMVDVDKLENFALNFLQMIIFTSVNLIITISVLSFIQVKLLLLYLTIIPIYSAIYYFYATKIKNAQHQTRKASEKLTASIVSFINTQELARMHGEELYEYKQV